MTEHTPGPWRITGPNIRSDNHTDGTGALLFVQHRPFHTSDLEFSWLDPDEQTANLKLVAAAPDLLAALVNLTNSLADDHQSCIPCEDLDWQQRDYQPHHPDCIIGEARAAIEKATGSTSD
tara:strand:+ start:622 stop:984 length:363 start_codon:yes stop_codon:yes gene_type:complete